MPGFGSMARVVGVLVLAAATVSPPVLTTTVGAAASSPSVTTDPQWTQALAWGRNLEGQVGLGSTTSNFPTPVSVGAELGFHHVSAGESHSLAVAADGTVYGWGLNDRGQVGVDSTANATVLHPSRRTAPTRVVGLSDVTKVAAGFAHSLALRSDGTVWAWGMNEQGQLGDGTQFDRHMPAQVHDLSGVVAIAAGAGHSLALRSDGTVRAWGSNRHGNLGDGTYTMRLTPVAVVGLTKVVAIDAGWGHSLALSTIAGLHTVWAWGGNDEGQLGDGTNMPRTRPVPVEGLTGITAIAAGSKHSLAVRSDGRVEAWGSNVGGTLGAGSIGSPRSTPVPVLGLTGVRSVTAGTRISAAVRDDGTVWTWGMNLHGQLGDGTFDGHRAAPAQLSGVSAVSAGGFHMVAVQPMPRFTVSVAPSGATMSTESGLGITVNTASLHGSIHTIALSVSGLPAGVTARFQPPTVVAGGSSTLFLASNEVAEVGPATLTITATATPATPYPTTVSTDFALTVAPGGCVTTSDTDVAIPDGGPPATGRINELAACGDLPDLNSSFVEVHIMHPRRGDLVIDFIDPHGRTIRLKSSDPTDTGPNVDAQYQIVLDPDLRDRLGDGPWQLRVEDVATGAVGHLDSWILYL